MTRGPLRIAAALLAGLLLVAVAAPALAQDAAPVPVPAPPSSGAPVPAPSKATSPRTGMSKDEFEARIGKSAAAMASMVLLKYGAAIAGVVVLALGFVRRRDERAGLVAPVRAGSPPPAPFPPLGAIALWVAMMVTAEAARYAVVTFGAPGARDGATSWAWGFAITAVVTIGVALTVADALGRARRVEGRTPWPAAPSLLLGSKGWTVATALSIPASLVWVLLLTSLGRPPEVQDLVAKAAGDDASSTFLVALGFLGVLVAPVTEEFLFRGAIFGSLRPRLGSRSAALISSLLFAAVHGDVTAMVPLFVLALVLCWVYERSGSLVAPITVHVLNNASSLLPIFLLHA